MRNTLCNCHYSPSQTSFGCVEITLSVCSTLYAIVFGPYPSYRKLWKSLLHTNIAYDTRMCHAFFFFLPKVIWANSRSLEGKVKICVRSVSLLWRDIGRSYFTQSLLMTWWCVMISTQGQLDRFKVTGK